MTSFLLAFYRKHLKRYSLVHCALIYLYRISRRIYHYVFIYVKALLRHNYRLVKISEYKSSDNVRKLMMVKPEVVHSNVPQVYPITLSGYLTNYIKGQVFPEISIVTVSNALVTGGSNFVTTRNLAICHDLYDFKRDYTSEELHLRLGLMPKLGRVLRYKKIKSPKKLPQAACFTDACASNYAHWITEVLPRIYHFCNSGIAVDIPMIIDDGLHHNLMESLHVVAGANAKLRTLSRDRAILVEQLSVVSATGYVPFDRRSHKLEGHSHGIFSPQTFKLMVNDIRKNLKISSGKATRKIYIRRNSGTRMLSNAEEIERLLVQHGFEVVEPEKLTFAEQVQLFSEADAVVGATGAAMANLIFCRPSATIVVMMAIHAKMPYGYWQNMAAAVGNEVKYVLGKITDSKFFGIHANFAIDPTDLMQALKSDNAEQVGKDEMVF